MSDCDPTAPRRSVPRRRRVVAVAAALVLLLIAGTALVSRGRNAQTSGELLAVAPPASAPLKSQGAPSGPRQVPFEAIEKGAIPAGVSWEGRLIAALRWADSRGTHLAVFSQRDRDDGDGETKELFADGYRLQPEGAAHSWSLNDSVDNCGLDMSVYFVRNSLEVTDLDGNGVAEVSFVYRLGCNGGVDYVQEKLFLIEDDKKYPVRGMTQPAGCEDDTAITMDGEKAATTEDPKGRIAGAGIASSDGCQDGWRWEGPMKPDKAFNSAPKAFRQFAEAKWTRFMPWGAQE